MLTAITVSMSRIAMLSNVPTKLSTGLHSDKVAIACFQIMKPTSTIPEGDRPALPEARSPNWRNDRMIASANWGPLRDNQSMNPKNRTNRMNSAKNSPMSALRRAMKPKVHTRLIVPSVQNNQVAALMTTVCHADARVANSETTWSSTPWFVAGLWKVNCAAAPPAYNNRITNTAGADFVLTASPFLGIGGQGVRTPLFGGRLVRRALVPLLLILRIRAVNLLLAASGQTARCKQDQHQNIPLFHCGRLDYHLLAFVGIPAPRGSTEASCAACCCASRSEAT